MREKQTRARSILYTTVVLTLSTLLARTILVSYNVYLSGKIGAIGIGIFELLMSVYLFAKTAACAGVSLAATRMSAEEPQSAKKTMQRILRCCLCLGSIIGVLLFFSSDFICLHFLDDPPGGRLAIKILAFSLPFLSMSSALGGYFIARRRMRGYAPVQIAEQLFRVGLTVILLERFSALPMSYSICSIALAITLSECVCFFSSNLYYRILLRSEEKQSLSVPNGKAFRKGFLRIAFPVGSGALLRASLNTVYNLLVPFGLKRSGASGSHSLASYGIIQGMALPILLYPSAVMNVLATQLVPEIAQMRTQGQTAHIAYITTRVLRITLLFSMLCAGVLFFFAPDISLAIFSKTDAAPYIRALAPLVPIMYLDMTTDGILKGLDLQMKVMWIGIVDSLLSLCLIYFLLPPFAMTGYLITIYAGETINTLLGHIELRRHIRPDLTFLKDVLKPLCGIVVAMGATQTLFSFYPCNGVFGCILKILCALIACGLVFLLSKTVQKEELHWVYGLLFKGSGRAKHGD